MNLINYINLQISLIIKMNFDILIFYVLIILVGIVTIIFIWYILFGIILIFKNYNYTKLLKSLKRYLYFIIVFIPIFVIYEVLYILGIISFKRIIGIIIKILNSDIITIIIHTVKAISYQLPVLFIINIILWGILAIVSIRYHINKKENERKIKHTLYDYLIFILVLLEFFLLWTFFGFIKPNFLKDIISYIDIFNDKILTAWLISIFISVTSLRFLLRWEYGEKEINNDLITAEIKWLNKESTFFIFKLIKEYFIIFKKCIINHIWYTILFLSFLSITLFIIGVRIKWIGIQFDKHFIPIWLIIVLGFILTSSDTDFTKRNINTTILVMWFSLVPLFISISYLFHYFYDNSKSESYNKITLSNNKLDWKIAWIKLNNLSWSHKSLEKIYSDTLNSSYVSTSITSHMIFNSFLTILLFTITIIFLKQAIKTNNQKKEIFNKLQKIRLYVELTNNNYKGNKDLKEKLKKEIEKDIKTFIPQFPIDNTTKDLDKLTIKLWDNFTKK